GGADRERGVPPQGGGDAAGLSRPDGGVADFVRAIAAGARLLPRPGAGDCRRRRPGQRRNEARAARRAPRLSPAHGARAARAEVPWGSVSPLTPTPLPPQSRGERVANGEVCAKKWSPING